MNKSILNLISSQWKDLDKTALIYQDVSVSYRQLRALVDTYKVFFYKLGLQTGDRVVMALENSIDFAAILLATMDMNMIEITLSPLETEAQIKKMAECVQAKTVIHSNIKWAIGAQREELPTQSKKNIIAEKKLGFSEAKTADFEKMANEGVISVQFTSGSTGNPKGVCHTIQGMESTIFASPHLREHADQTLFLALPIFNSYGKTQLLEFLYMNATLFLANKFGLPEELCDSLYYSACTVFEAPPSIYEILMRSRKLSANGLPRLNRAGMAGGKLRVEMIKKLKQLLPGTTMTNRFGVTEISGGICRTLLDVNDAVEGILPCGEPFPFVKIRVEDEQGNRLAANAKGEVVVESKGMMWGYLFQKEPDVKSYRTGDLGMIDERGRLYLIDRKNDMIKRAGVRIFPKQIENAMAETEGIGVSVVFGIDDAATGLEKVILVVMPNDGSAAITENAVYKKCREKLSRDFLPDHIFVKESLPIAPNGKIDMVQLKAAIRSEIAT